MSTTQYQLLHRYMNEGTNTPITNQMEMKYEEVLEFYTDPDHRIFSTVEIDKATAIDEQQEMIYHGNSGDNPKANMIFAYDGTKKIKHKKWVNEAPGYIVRDYTKIARSKIGNRGDYSKEFTTIDKATPEDGGTVICVKAVFDKYFPTTTISVATDNSFADAGSGDNRYYTEAKIQKMIDDATPFKLTGGWTSCTTKSRTTGTYGEVQFSGPVAIGGNNMTRKTLQTGHYGETGSFICSTEEMYLYGSVIIKKEQVVMGVIPRHYEDANSYPYLIKDTYKRIQLSPWFVNCTTCSLDAALEKAKILVDMIGLDNVKLIKIVPFGQFIKIR